MTTDEITLLRYILFGVFFLIGIAIANMFKRNKN